MPIFGPLLAGLSRLVATRIGHWVIAAFAFLGLQLAATEFVVEPLLQYVQGLMGGAPADILEWIAFLNVDKYVTMVLSAYAAAASVGALKLRRKPS